MTEQEQSGQRSSEQEQEKHHHSAERIHQRGEFEQSHPGTEHGTPEQTPGGPQPRGEHPIEPAEGSRESVEEEG